MSFSFKMTKYGDKFRDMERKAKPEAARIASRAALVTYGLSQQFCPVLTGELKGSGYIEQTGETRFKVGYSAKHAAAVNFGTAFQDANGFLTIAFELSRKDFERGLREFFARVSE